MKIIGSALNNGFLIRINDVTYKFTTLNGVCGAERVSGINFISTIILLLLLAINGVILVTGVQIKIPFVSPNALTLLVMFCYLMYKMINQRHKRFHGLEHKVCKFIYDGNFIVYGISVDELRKMPIVNAHCGSVITPIPLLLIAFAVAFNLSSIWTVVFIVLVGLAINHFVLRNNPVSYLLLNLGLSFQSNLVAEPTEDELAFGAWVVEFLFKKLKGE